MDRNVSRSTINEDEKAYIEWMNFGRKLAFSAVLHPFVYTKTLIQLGYEPIPPQPGKTFFGKDAMFLPNVFEYADYIRRTDGFLRLYCGLTPKLVGSYVALICSETLAFKVGLPKEEDLLMALNWHPATVTEEQLYLKFKTDLKRDLLVTVTSIIVSHPFQVISVRMMAQFIGKESLYKSVFDSAGEIFQNDGISGFFAGLMPRMLGDVAFLLLTSSTLYIISKHPVRNNISRIHCVQITRILVSIITYPFELVSTCMMVTGSKLKAGQPPIMPIYASWRDCWNDLMARGELDRGSAYFMRCTK